MIKIEKDNDNLIIRDLPIRGWSTFLFPICIPFFGYLMIRENEIPYFWLVLIILLGVFLESLFLYMVLDARSVKIKVSKTDKNVTISQKSFLKHNLDIYFFDEIAGLATAEEDSLEHRHIFLPLKDGRKVELSESTEANLQECSEIATLINSYVFAQNTFFQPTVLDHD